MSFAWTTFTPPSESSKLTQEALYSREAKIKLSTFTNTDPAFQVRNSVVAESVIDVFFNGFTALTDSMKPLPQMPKPGDVGVQHEFENISGCNASNDMHEDSKLIRHSARIVLAREAAERAGRRRGWCSDCQSK
ncbi:hypothetical protein D9619_000438 [Psilocybe cf. subviscida]|uniref:Uncharacterized protein n=1 Tax=Psilocybe cf. subviscida TaxID=2480587 RepID=A0A8H5F2H4_9AGAR|nr:hypothetical protein D9619_000438 [Psilocybe cf. subviscida]